MSRPVTFTRTLFWLIWSKWLGDPSLPSVLDHPPRKKGPLLEFFFSTKHFSNAPTCSFHQNPFWLIWSQ